MDNQTRLDPTPLPSMQEIIDLPLAERGVFELDGDAVQTLRSRIYALNSDNAYGWRWRTSKLPLKHVKPRNGYADMSRYMLLVWRVS